MGRSMHEIEFSFEQARKQADKLEGIATNLNNLSEIKLNETLQGISAVWKGENASAYLGKGAELQERMNRTAKQLQNSAIEIRTVAKRIYDAEKAAYEIARQRLYDKMNAKTEAADELVSSTYGTQ